jgi:hypothetical protein
MMTGARASDIRVGIWLVVFLVCAAFPAFAGEVREARSRNCDAWIEGTRKMIESKPVHRWRDVAIAAVARACDGVPASLRSAAAAYGKARSDEVRAQALAHGAATVLKANCLVSAPENFADSLIATCPLPIGEERRPSPKALGYMRAAEYVFLNALMTSLMAADAYTDTAHRIVLDFVLSSANMGEARKKKSLPHGR